MLCARLRTAKNDCAAVTVEEVGRIVKHIRLVWPDTRIINRDDSGFCREEVSRGLALAGTLMAKAQCDTIRLRL